MLHVRLSAAVAIVVAAFFSGCGEAGNSAKRSVRGVRKMVTPATIW